MIGKILFPNVNGRALIQAGNDIYIIQSLGYYRDQEVVFEPETALRMPSLLYAIDVLHSSDFTEVVKFIKSNW